MRIGAVILASGFSKRLGADKNKLFLTFKGKSFLQICIDNVMKATFDEIVLVTSYLEAVQGNLTMIKGVQLVQNRHPELGISESIKLGLEEINECDAYMFFTIDQPQLQVDTINRLKTFAERGRIIVPIYNGQKGSPTIFGCDFKAKLLTISGDVGGKQIINQHKHFVTFVQIEAGSEGMDIDTMAEYMTLKKSEG